MGKRPEFDENRMVSRNDPSGDIGSRLVAWPVGVRSVQQITPAGRVWVPHMFRRSDMEAPQEESIKRRAMRRSARLARRDPLCRRCGCHLSMYNDDTLCGPCQRSAYDHPTAFAQQV